MYKMIGLVNFELKYFLKYFEYIITIAPLLITIHHAKEVPNRLSMLNRHAKFTTKVQMPIYSRRKWKLIGLIH